MKRYLLVLLCMVGLFMLTGNTAYAQGKSKGKPKPSAKVCVEKIHVIRGCTACQAMEAWLKKAGVELERTDVEQGQYRLYPTVEYSDDSADHGERMYKQLVTIPGKICIVSCSVGTN